MGQQQDRCYTRHGEESPLVLKLFFNCIPSVLIAILGVISVPGYGQQATLMMEIKGGDYVPLYGVDSNKVTIKNFYLDQYPVTNEQFKQFLLKQPKWRPSSTSALFADKNYLSRWNSDTSYPNTLLSNAPVTEVSWFAAKAYCACQGKRLPTVDEWEFAAMADKTRKDAREDSLYNQKILSGYEEPKTYTKPIGRSEPNYWGIYDLHGLVWEWTFDFNSVLISGESRKDVDTDRNLFCAGGAVNATDLMNYAAFMRYAMRGSLKARYCVRTQGFRCASNSQIK